MDRLQELVGNLQNKDNQVAYRSLQELQETSETSGEVAEYSDTFYFLLSSEKSYERIRGLTLLAVNARWLDEWAMEHYLPQYLELTLDVKPIVSRKALEGLLHIIQAHPSLSNEIKEKIKLNDYSKYPDTMQPLLMKDTKRILEIE